MDARRDTIDEWVQAWHDEELLVVPLHVWLGWSWDEFRAFVEQDTLPERETKRRKLVPTKVTV